MLQVGGGEGGEGRGVGNLVFCIVQPGHQPDDNFLEPRDTSQVRLGKPGRDKETTDFCDHRLLEGGRVLLLSVHQDNNKLEILIFYSGMTLSLSHYSVI